MLVFRRTAELILSHRPEARLVAYEHGAVLVELEDLHGAVGRRLSFALVLEASSRRSAADRQGEDVQLFGEALDPKKY